MRFPQLSLFHGKERFCLRRGQDAGQTGGDPAERSERAGTVCPPGGGAKRCQPGPPSLGRALPEPPCPGVNIRFPPASPGEDCGGCPRSPGAPCVSSPAGPGPFKRRADELGHPGPLGSRSEPEPRRPEALLLAVPPGASPRPRAETIPRPPAPRQPLPGSACPGRLSLQSGGVFSR